MADVFISYSRRDSAFVAELTEGLRSHGKEAWVDIEGLRDAEVFPVALRRAIESADGFVFVISPDSVSSEYCDREIEDAVEFGKRIVPIDLKRVADDDLPESIRFRNWIPVDGNLDETVARVVKALDTDLEHARAHTHWELKAVEWDEKTRDRSLLLRGTGLAEAEAWIAGAESKDPPPTPLQRQYLTAGRQAAAARQRRVAVGAVAVAAVSIALLVFAVIQRGRAQTARQTNESRALAVTSQAQGQIDPERALLLAVASEKTHRTPEALFALRSALDADALLHRFSGFGVQSCGQPAPGVTYGPGGVLAVGACSGRISLFGRDFHRIGSLIQPDPAAPLRFDPHGNLAVAGNGVIRIYRRGLSYKRTLRVPGHPQRIVYSGDGRYLAATSSSATQTWTSVWNADTGELTMRKRGPPPTNPLAPLVRGIGFVDGGRALAIGSPVGPVTIRSSVGGRLIRSLPDTEDDLIGFDPPGRHLVVGGIHTRGAHSSEGVVTAWDTRTWTHRVVATAVRLRPRNIYVSPDGSRVAVGWSDGSAGIYSLVTGSQLARFLGPPKAVSALSYSHDSKRVAVGAADGSVRIWRAGGVESAYTETGARLDYDLPAVTDRQVIVASRPNLMRVFTLPQLRLVATRRVPLPRRTTYTNTWLSTRGNTAVMIRGDGRADVWSLGGMRRILTLPALPTALAATDDNGNRMILLDGEHNEFVSLVTHAVTPIRQHSVLCRGQWRAATFSYDGSLAVAGSSCGELYIWNGRTAQLLRRIVLPGQISALALASNKRTIATASPEGRLTLIDRATGAQRSIGAAPRGINSLAFGAGDRILAAGVDDGTVRMWDAQSGRLLRELPFPATVTVRFTPNGKSLIAAELTGALGVIDPCPACNNAKVLLAEAKRRLTRKLTPAETRTYLSGF